MNKDELSLEGAVLKIDGQLTLLIPLDGGGSEFVAYSGGDSEMCGKVLKIVIPNWLAGLLRIDEGDLVCVSNLDGKLHVVSASPRIVH